MGACRYCDGEGYYYVVPRPDMKVCDATHVRVSELEDYKRVCLCKKREKHG